MNIIVLGGCGFIGSYIVRGLVNQGHNVRVFDRLNASVENILPVMNKIDLFYGDFANEVDVENAIKDYDIVYHLISTTFPSSTIESGVYDVQTNLLPTIKLLEICNKLNVEHLVYLSSGGTVYGETAEVPIKESIIPHPITLYGLSKLTIENYIKLYTHKSRLKYTILRASNVYGPKQNIHGVQGLIAVCIGNLIYDRPQVVWGNGDYVFRDYIFIEDLTEAAVKISETKGENKIFNVGSEKMHSINEVLNLLEIISNTKIRRINKEKRSVDVSKNLLCIDKIKQELKWSPKVELREGIKLTWEWANNKYKKTIIV